MHVLVDPTRFCFYGDQRLLFIQNDVGSFCYSQNFPISENQLLNHRIQGVMGGDAIKCILFGWVLVGWEV